MLFRSKAVKKGKVAPKPGADLGALVRDAGLITPEEYLRWHRKEALRRNVIKVDDFPQDFGRAEILGRLAQETNLSAKAA